ncbi:hypothetical protein [Chryseobacterium taklimakanense]|uniref:Uncharacterized protein n=1 Tax=Chryseobacterium taklimakanense TaxID=536441 RepID=A0A3G8WQ35_9FLAO|nr:hypothetical protein [Chryseobacterium taklimakanense]AZI20304.1 hypothetical protein EIH08_05875 [Chryseobacterium taklimakanense]
MKIKAAFIILFFLNGCQGKFESKLTNPDSVWLYAIKDAANNNKEKTMLLKFYSNGIADEADTDFVNFKWSYNPVTKPSASTVRILISSEKMPKRSI